MKVGISPPARPLLDQGCREDQDTLLIAEESLFNQLLALERKRTERTGDPFVLMILEIAALDGSAPARTIADICYAIRAETRDIDLYGWYRYSSAIGVIFTALQHAERSAVLAALTGKTDRALSAVLRPADAKKVGISFHFFPEDFDPKEPPLDSDRKLYPDLIHRDRSRALYHFLKRGIDIAGSLSGLILFSPLFLIIAVLIKCTSKGPVLFKQRRVGRFGREFNFLKFRTMYINNNSAIHEQYVRQLIGQKNLFSTAPGAQRPVFKIVNDPRITPIGPFLRKSSLDELPQFINVLRGEMSLVGPRPPIPYEVAAYRVWHRRRIIEIKPGITGLWQIYGRSRTTFDEMVRLDLRYVREQSLWLDLKIILKTPRVILSGDGAF
jgi:lipopolysaccharide/colanic/teichoic acid biosynthesis glycosyltransferase